MKIVIAGFIAAICLASVNCQDTINFIRTGEQGQHLYSYGGQTYAVQQPLHDLYRTNPEVFKQRFMSHIQKAIASRFDAYESDREAQSVNTFKPNKKNPQAVYFPQDSQEPSAFTQFTSRHPVPDQDRQNVNQQSFNEPPYNRPSFQQNFNSQNRNPNQPTFNPQGTNQQNFNQQPPNRKNSNDDPFEISVDTGYNIPIPQREVQDRGNKAITEFAWRLFKASNTQSDYVLSPMSPQILLSYLTWVADGRTRDELVAANGYGSPEKLQKVVDGLLRDGAKRELQIATAFFVSQDMRLNQQFFDQSKSHVDIVNVDFKNSEAAGRTITKWAKQKTKGGLKINEIVVLPSTKIALTSAVYYKANWIYKFNSAQPGLFYTPQGTIQVPMMNIKKKYRWGQIGEIAEWAAIPYESEDSLIIILPNKDQTLERVISAMNEKALVDVLYDFDRDSSNADVNITMPKFKLESTSNLIEPLKSMGIQTLFSPRAELPYLSDYNSVTVSNAQQQSSIDVNEEGTVVVSFTNINVVALSFSPPVPSVDFVVDRPFLAVIANRDRNIPYVIAKITNPTY